MSAALVSGRVVLDLTTGNASAKSVSFIPVGVTVDVQVTGPADIVAVRELREFGPGLRYVVVGTDAEHVASWVRALRGEAPVGPWVAGDDL